MSENNDKCYKMKATLSSEDGGRTWFVYNIFYVTEAENEYDEYEFTDYHDFDSMELKRT